MASGLVTGNRWRSILSRMAADVDAGTPVIDGWRGAHERSRFCACNSIAFRVLLWATRHADHADR